MLLNKFCLAAAIVMFTSACASDAFIVHNGNMPSNERISKVEVGSTKNFVAQTLGAPSCVTSFDQNTWIYMSSDIKKVAFFEPEEVNRDVLTIKFNKMNQVESIHRLNRNSGQEVEIAEDETPSVGHEPGFFEKFFGGIGNYSPFPAVSSETM